MGLLVKGNTNQYGAKEEYWRILSININLQYAYCDITLGSYVSEEARQAGAENMNTKKVRAKWTEDEFFSFFTTRAMSAPGETIYKKAYEYIVYKDDFFKNAQNV